MPSQANETLVNEMAADATAADEIDFGPSEGVCEPRKINKHETIGSEFEDWGATVDQPIRPRLERQPKSLDMAHQ